jgi:hypothetical protein
MLKVFQAFFNFRVLSRFAAPIPDSANDLGITIGIFF